MYVKIYKKKAEGITVRHTLHQLRLLPSGSDLVPNNAHSQGPSANLYHNRRKRINL